NDKVFRRGAPTSACKAQWRGISMNDNKNTILAIVLSALVLIGWQYFFAGPQEKARQEQQQAQQQKQNVPAPSQSSQQTAPAGTPQVPGQPSAPAHAAPGDR